MIREIDLQIGDSALILHDYNHNFNIYKIKNNILPCTVTNITKKYITVRLDEFKMLSFKYNVNDNYKQKKSNNVTVDSMLFESINQLLAEIIATEVEKDIKLRYPQYYCEYLTLQDILLINRYILCKNQ